MKKLHIKYIGVVASFSVAFFTLGMISGGIIGYNFINERSASVKKVSTYTTGFEDAEQELEKNLTETWNKGYSNGFEDARDKYENGEPYNSSGRIGFTGSLNHSGYSFYFRDEVQVMGESFDGYSFVLNDTVVLKSGNYVSDTDKMCNHEVLHQLFPSYRHSVDLDKSEDSIYFLQDKVDLSICDSLISKVRSR